MSLAIQEAVLYGLLSYGSGAWAENAEQLSSDLFHGEYREVFEVINQKYRDGQLVDFFTVADAIPESDAVDKIVRSFCGRSTLAAYIGELRRSWGEVKAAQIGAELLNGADRDKAIKELRSLDVLNKTAEYQEFQQLASAWLDRISDSIENPNPGIKTGWTDIDNLLGGIRGGNLTIIAARPSMGKTSAALNISDHQQKPVLIFSLEMSESEVIDRLISGRGVDHGRLRNPSSLTESDWPKITAATQELAKKKILINDTGGISMSAIEALSRKAHGTYNLALIVIDYLQLVTVKAESRLQEVSEVSRRLKALAKNLNVPVLALSQLNRAAEHKSAPTLSDLRESGQIEQDADQVVFIQREEVVDPDSNKKGTGEFFIRKNRHGEIGNRTLTWQGKYQRFVNYQRDHYARSAA